MNISKREEINILAQFNRVYRRLSNNTRFVICRFIETWVNHRDEGCVELNKDITGRERERAIKAIKNSVETILKLKFKYQEWDISSDDYMVSCTNFAGGFSWYGDEDIFYMQMTFAGLFDKLISTYNFDGQKGFVLPRGTEKERGLI